MTAKKSAGDASRYIPVAVKKELRKEVGFGCPVAGCESPYLEYHHFDPPWHVEPHNDPERMIALCAEHHAKADAWTVEQVRALKQKAHQGKEVAGKFEWMRRDLLAVVGGNLYYETPVILQLDNRPVVWFERDEDRHLLLNLRMSLAGETPRTELVNNDWIIQGGPADVESPPKGSRLTVRYDDGDYIKIHFREWEDPKSLVERFGAARRHTSKLTFPLVTAEIHIVLKRAGIQFDQNGSVAPGILMTDSFSYGSAVGWDLHRPQGSLDAVHSIAAKYLPVNGPAPR